MKKFQGYRSRVLFKGTLEHNEFIRIITFKPKKKLEHVPQYWSNKEFSRVSFKGTLQGYRSMVPFNGTIQLYRSRVSFKGTVQGSPEITLAATLRERNISIRMKGLR